jgi:hypothetical protein
MRRDPADAGQIRLDQNIAAQILRRVRPSAYQQQHSICHLPTYVFLREKDPGQADGVSRGQRSDVVQLGRTLTTPELAG